MKRHPSNEGYTKHSYWAFNSRCVLHKLETGAFCNVYSRPFLMAGQDEVSCYCA
jgi:hypothetical protein